MLIHHGEKVRQEFYCRHCPADDPNSDDPQKRKTGGHFRVLFSVGYDSNIEIHCPNPKCKHVHSRHVVSGEIRDGYGNSGNTDVVRSAPSGWSRDPITRVAVEVKAASPNENFHRKIRGGIVIKDEEKDLSEAAKQARKSVPMLELYQPDKAGE